jgi:hypothetical protein
LNTNQESALVSAEKETEKEVDKAGSRIEKNIITNADSTWTKVRGQAEKRMTKVEGTLDKEIDNSMKESEKTVQAA